MAGYLEFALAAMTPSELKSLRHALGLSAEGMARFLKVKSGRTVHRWESGERDIPGSVIVLLAAMRDDQRIREHFSPSRGSQIKQPRSGKRGWK